MKAFIEHLLYARHPAHLILSRAHELGVIIIPILQMGKQRHREVKWLAPGYKVSEGQSQDLSLESLIPESTLNLSIYSLISFCGITE